MSGQKLIVAGESEWLDWLHKKIKDGYERGCSGVGDCKYCTRDMYFVRSPYLQSYLKTYLQNKTAVDQGLLTMPKLFWYPAHTAQEFNLGEYHKEKCDLGRTVADCECSVAKLFRVMYPDVTEYSVEKSLDQIVPAFLKLLKKNKIEN